MAKKLAFRAIIVYVLFGLAMYLYLFYLANTSIPAQFKGTSGDPATFLTQKDFILSEEFSNIRNLLFFLSTPYKWLFYFIILITGLSLLFEKWAKSISRFHFIQTAVYVFWLSLAAYVVTFPLNYLSYHFSRAYEISTQSFSSWMKDGLIDFWVGLVIMLILVSVLYILMRKFQQRWWLAAWVLLIPFMIFMMFIQPVVIAPLYNDFYPLKDKELEEKILNLADEADIPADHVFEVNMSEKTNALNAYVTGIGSNSRIVLWDTTLERLSDREILFIMAHEMAHYVEKHIYFGMAGYLLLSFIGLWLTAKMMNHYVRKRGKTLKITSVSQLSSLPVIFINHIDAFICIQPVDELGI